VSNVDISPGRAPLARSLREQVARELRAAIVYGELAAGEPLLEERIAASLGVSRGPVREALRTLEHEGLVIAVPQRRAVVAGLPDDELREVVVPVRLQLEQFAFAHARPRLGSEQLTALEAIAAAMDVAGADDDLIELAELDMHFHRLVVEASGQFHTLQIWTTLSPRIRAHFYRLTRAEAAPELVGDEHRALLAVLRDGSPDELRAALERHILEGVEGPQGT